MTVPDGLHKGSILSSDRCSEPVASSSPALRGPRRGKRSRNASWWFNRLKTLTEVLRGCAVLGSVARSLPVCPHRAAGLLHTGEGSDGSRETARRVLVLSRWAELFFGGFFELSPEDEDCRTASVCRASVWGPAAGREFRASRCALSQGLRFEHRPLPDLSLLCCSKRIRF